MDINWQMISAMVAGTVLVVGLVKFYFSILSKRLDTYNSELSCHVLQEEQWQAKLLETLTAMSGSLIKLETRAENYITQGVHLDALRKIDESITASRHSTLQSVQTLITTSETNIANQLKALDKRVSHLEGDK